MVVCEVCGEEFEYLPTHLFYKHDLTKDEYLEKFPNADVGLNPAERPEVRKKISENRNLTEEGRRKLSENMTEWHKKHPEAFVGENNPINKNNIDLSGENNPAYGKVGYWKDKKRPEHSRRMTGEGNPMKRKELRDRQSGEGHWTHNLGKDEKHPLEDNPDHHMKTEKSKEFFRKLAKERVKDQSNDFGSGVSFPEPYYVEELGHKVRSTWEEEVGKILVDMEIIYQYEQKFTVMMNGSKRKYHPDFSFENIVIEPHLFLRGIPIKFRRFHEQYPEYYYIILGEKDFDDPSFCDEYLLWDEREKLPQIIEELRSE